MLNSFAEALPADQDLNNGVVGIWAGEVHVAKNGWFFYGSRDNLKLTFDL